MIYIAINVLFNSFVLGMTFTAGGALLSWHIPAYWYWISGYLISGILTLIGYTRLGTNIVGLFMGGRKMIGREREKLEPLFRDVIVRVNKQYNTDYRYEDFKITITDDKTVNAFALGHNNIIINRGCFEVFSDDELKAILAHEMAHLYYRDSLHSIALIFSSFGTRLVMWMYSIFVVIQQIFSKASFSNESGALAGFLSFVPVIIFLPVVILNWIGSKVFTLLNMAISRKAEYRADMFSASLGYKIDMIQALQIIDSISVTDNSFLAKITATHPAPMQRIGALEDEVIQHQRLGSLILGTPLVSNATEPQTVNSDFIRLTAILSAVGILWCGYTVYDYYTHSEGTKPRKLTDNNGSVRENKTHLKRHGAFN